MQVVTIFGISVEQWHLDSTSFALDGAYESLEEAPQAIEIC